MSGTVVFDGPDALPRSVAVEFYGDDYAAREIRIYGPKTEYTFDLPGNRYVSAKGIIVDRETDYTGWLRETQPVNVAPWSWADALLRPGTVLAPIVFKPGIRLDLPVTDLRGRTFKSPRRWRCRGGDAIALEGAVNASVVSRGNDGSQLFVTGLAYPGRVRLSLLLACSDAFAQDRPVSTTVSIDLPASWAGRTVSRPQLRIDVSPPTVRAIRLPGRKYALFAARDGQSPIAVDASAAYTQSRRGGWGLLAHSEISTVDEPEDPDHDRIPPGWTGLRVRLLAPGRRRVWLCVPNVNGIMPSLDDCATAIVGSRR